MELQLFGELVIQLAQESQELLVAVSGKALANAPIVIITGRLDLEEAARAAGARGLAGKPLDVEALVELVEDLVSEGVDAGANRVHDFKHVPANGDALRVAIMDRVRRPFATAEHKRHWGLNE